MKRMLLLVLVSVGPAHAEVVTVPFSEKVFRVQGTPFGLTNASVGAIVSGSFTYDTATPSAGFLCTNCQDFYAKPPSAFTLTVGNVTITSSDFVLRTSNNVLNYGGSDLFIADAISSREFRVNGMQAQGAASVWLVDTDQVLFPADTDAHVLPSQLDVVDFIYGEVFDHSVPGGANFLWFGVPEPSVALLTAQSLWLIALGRRRRSTSGVLASQR